MSGLLFGAIIGAAVMYFWGDRIRDAMPRAKDWGADALGKIGESAEDALDRARSSVRESVSRGQETLRARTGTRESSDHEKSI
ncbi:MAG: YtxH domain-containing protein [Candidatus Rokuibacteriota bacterium]